MPKKSRFKRIDLRKVVPAFYGISSFYGYRIHPITGQRHFHNGIDIAAPCGALILAPFGGVVKRYSSRAGGYMLYLLLNSDETPKSWPDRLILGFAHLYEYAVQNNQRVKQGDLLGWVGSTGFATGCHVHFTVASYTGAADFPDQVAVPINERVFYDPLEFFKLNGDRQPA